MMLWLVLAAVTLAVLTLLLVPLLRRQSAGPARIGYDLAVYRDQLAEVDRDGERGLMSDPQMAAARTEIQRRMLTAGDAGEPEANDRSAETGRRLRLAAAMSILVGLPMGTLALYGTLGAPGLPSQPFESRKDSPEFKMTAMAAKLKEELDRVPESRGYLLLGETYRSLRRFDEAVAALRRAIDLGAAGAETFSTLGETLVLASGGGVGPDARAAFQQALQASPGDTRARFYLGLSEAQIGKYAEALAIWRDLEKDTPADAPWRTMLERQIALVAKDGKIDPNTVAPQAPSSEGAPARPPAMAQLPPGAAEDATIRKMVEGLAAKMEKNPNDLEGWLRLGQSYRVLGDLDKARAAIDKAEKLSPQAVEPKMAMADIQLAAAQGDDLPADFIATMRDIHAIAPDNGDALYYVGAAEAQAGHSAEARALWTKLLAQLPADAPERADLVKQMDGLKP